MKKRPSTKTGSARNHLRIIGGQWRGRKLNFADVDGLRPTGDRIRETLFNWLQADLPGARVLDLFSGSGALGLEALSRDAGHVLMLERNPSAAQQIRENLGLLKDQAGELRNVDTLAQLTKAPAQGYDVVFLDPPFALELWDSVIDLLEQNRWLSDTAAIYIETPRNLAIQTPNHWQLHRQKDAGQVTYRLYYRDSDTK